MTRALLFLLLAMPAAGVVGAEAVEHRGIWMHPEQFRTPQLANQWIEKIAAARLNAIYPLDNPTTARVLARFDSGKPAVTLNRLDQGETALVNWQAARSAPPAVDRLVKDMLTRFRAGRKNTYQLNTTETAAKYRREEQSRANQWLRDLDFPARLIDEETLDQVPRDAVLILYGQYYVAQPTADWLEEFVRGGGRCLVIGGPVFSIKHPSLQRVLGMRATGAYFHGPAVVSPEPGQDMLPPGRHRYPARTRANGQVGGVSHADGDGPGASRLSRGKGAKPRAWVSAAVFFNKESADRVCQDWYGWLTEGIIDYVLPMAYTEDNQTLAKAFAEWKAADPKMERIIPGLSIYSRKDGTAVPRDLALVRSQLDMCRTYQTHGNQFFSLGYLREPLINLLAESVFTAPARPWYPE